MTHPLKPEQTTPSPTQSEFIKQYCLNSNITEQELNSLGTFAAPCRCIAEDCKGWAMISKNTAKDHFQLYVR